LDEEIGELRALHRPIGQRRLARLDQLLADCAAVQQRLDDLHTPPPKRLPPGVAAPGDC